MPGHYYYKAVIEPAQKEWKDERNHRVSMIQGKPPAAEITEQDKFFEERKHEEKEDNFQHLPA
jgi:hypothetical protein